MKDDLEDFVIEVWSQIGMVFDEPGFKGEGDVVELGFVKEGFFHVGINGESADVDFDGMVFVKAAVG